MVRSDRVSVDGKKLLRRPGRLSKVGGWSDRHFARLLPVVSSCHTGRAAHSARLLVTGEITAARRAWPVMLSVPSTAQTAIGVILYMELNSLSS